MTDKTSQTTNDGKKNWLLGSQVHISLYFPTSVLVSPCGKKIIEGSLGAKTAEMAEEMANQRLKESERRREQEREDPKRESEMERRRRMCEKGGRVAIHNIWNFRRQTFEIMGQIDGKRGQELEKRRRKEVIDQVTTATTVIPCS